MACLLASMVKHGHSLTHREESPKLLLQQAVLHFVVIGQWQTHETDRAEVLLLCCQTIATHHTSARKQEIHYVSPYVHSLNPKL